MNMKCSNYPQDYSDRADYVANRKGDLLAHFHVADADTDRFLSEERVKALTKQLWKEELSLNDMLARLGSAFQTEWKGSFQIQSGNSKDYAR